MARKSLSPEDRERLHRRLEEAGALLDQERPVEAWRRVVRVAAELRKAGFVRVAARVQAIANRIRFFGMPGPVVPPPFEPPPAAASPPAPPDPFRRRALERGSSRRLVRTS